MKMKKVGTTNQTTTEGTGIRNEGRYYGSGRVPQVRAVLWR